MEAAGRLRHPNIAAQLGWGSDLWNGRETLYVVVEHLSGGSLRDVLDRGRLLSASQSLALGLDVCRALDVVHRAGLIHGDIRPSTLVFGDDRVLRVVDVGLGQLLGGVLWTDATQVSNERAMYVAPEIAARQPAVPKSDVYSLCLTMLECVTGSVPFVGDSTVATLSNRIGKLLPVSADLGALASVLEHAGRPEPEDRYSVAEFGRALMQTAEKLPRPTPIAVLGAGLGDRGAAPTVDLVRPAAAAVADPSAVGPSPDLTRPLLGRSGQSEDDDAPVSETAASEAAPSELAPSELAASEPASSEPAATADPAPPVALRFPSGPAALLPPPSTYASAEATAAEAPAAEAQAEKPAHAAALPEQLAPTEVVELVAPTIEPTAVMPVVAARVPKTEAPPAGPAGPPPIIPPALFDEQWPSRRRRSKAWWLIPVLLVIAVAAAAITLYATRTKSHPVPALIGLTQGEALNQVSSSGWTLETPQEPSETVEVGKVIRTDPVAGVKLKEGRILTLVVSSGPAPRPLPELKGLTLQAATDVLAKLKLNIEQGDQVFDDAVPAGSVVSWTVPEQPGLKAGDTVTPGVLVMVQLSKGPSPRLPELKGLTLDQATAALVAQKLQIKQGDPAFDETVPPGVVLSWTVPAHPDLVAGAVVDPSTVVQVVLSNGPKPRTVPSLIGLAPADAKAAVEALNLVYAEGPTEFSPGVPAGAVASQDPVKGTSVARGSTVTVAISKGPDAVPLPAIGNLPLQQAINLLSSSGLAVGKVTGNQNGVVTLATVNGAGVSEGQPLARGTAVDLTLS